MWCIGVCVCVCVCVWRSALFHRESEWERAHCLRQHGNQKRFNDMKLIEEFVKQFDATPNMKNKSQNLGLILG